eukprot:UN24283
MFWHVKVIKIMYFSFCKLKKSSQNTTFIFCQLQSSLKNEMFFCKLHHLLAVSHSPRKTKSPDKRLLFVLLQPFRLSSQLEHFFFSILWS